MFFAGSKVLMSLNQTDSPNRDQILRVLARIVKLTSQCGRLSLKVRSMRMLRPASQSPALRAKSSVPPPQESEAEEDAAVHRVWGQHSYSVEQPVEKHHQLAGTIDLPPGFP